MTVKNLNDQIVSTPDVLGGKPCIAGRRISVQDVMVWHELMSLSADEIAAEYELVLADIYAALAYYYDHREEIAEQLREEEVFIEAMHRQPPASLAYEPSE